MRRNEGEQCSSSMIVLLLKDEENHGASFLWLFENRESINDQGSFCCIMLVLPPNV